MKKLSLKQLKLDASEMLERNQLKTVFGGDYGSGGTCKVYVRPADTSPGDPSGYWTDCLYSVDEAQSMYNAGFFGGYGGGGFNGDWLVTGYRCQSCN